MKVYIKNNLYQLLTVVLIVCFVFYKIPHLFLPFYWDEATPYSYAIQYMYEHGLSLLPNALPAEYFRGHPLLFYFMETGWMKIFGNTIFISRCFPLLLSVLLIGGIYIFGKTFFNSQIGFYAALLFAAQPVFLAQSSAVLPEVCVSLFTLAALFYYLKEKLILYAIFSASLVLTKESGIVLPIAIIFLEIYLMLTKKQRSLKRLLILSIPICIASSFYLFQRITMGWFLFPLHVGYISFQPLKIVSQLFDGYMAYIFIYYGRIVLSISLIAAIAFMLIKNQIIVPVVQKKALRVFIVFSALFLLFSAVNVYSPRYILCLFPLIILMVVSIIYQAIGNYKVLTPIFIITLFLFQLFNDWLIRTDADHNLGFVSTILVQKDAINYCEQQNWYKKKVYTHFLMEKNLTNFNLGYLKNFEKIFTNVSSNFNETVELLVVSSVENKLIPDEIINSNRFKLIKEFNRDHSWVKIYASDLQ